MTTRSTVPRRPPATENPAQFASQYRVTGLAEVNRFVVPHTTVIPASVPGSADAKLPMRNCTV